MTDYATLRTTMVDTQIRPSDVTKFTVIEAMLTVPREAFVPSSARDAAYVDTCIPLDARRVVLDARTLAKMLDALDIQNDELVLDVGAGFGYSAAIIARMAEAVIAVESDEASAAEAQAALSEIGADNAVVHVAPLADGAAEHGPYDVILLQGGVGALPESLTSQLKEGGRMAVLFMEGALGVVRIGYKIDGEMSWRFAFNAAAPVMPGFEQPQEFKL